MQRLREASGEGEDRTVEFNQTSINLAYITVDAGEEPAVRRDDHSSPVPADDRKTY